VSRIQITPWGGCFQRIGETHEIKEVYWKPVIDWLIDWLIDRLVCWLVGCLRRDQLNECIYVAWSMHEQSNEQVWAWVMIEQNIGYWNSEVYCLTCFDIRNYRLEQWVLLYKSSWNSWSVLLRQTTNWGYSVPHHTTTHYKRCCRCCATTKWEIILICMRQCNLQREGCRKEKGAADATAREGFAAGESMLDSATSRHVKGLTTRMRLQSSVLHCPTLNDEMIRDWTALRNT